MKTLLLHAVLFVLLSSNLLADLNLQPGKWLVVTKAVDGPSNYDLDFLAAVAASSALTDGEPAVLAITHPIYLFADAWHADYVNRYNPESALIVGQNVPGIPGVSQLIVLNSAPAGAEQAKEIATTVWAGSDQVVICSLDGNDYENALTAASLASRLKVPLLYSSPATPGDLDTVLAQLGVQSALVVGSPLTLPVPSSTLSGALAVVTWLRNNGHAVGYLAAVNPADRDVHPDGSKLSLVATVLAARRGGVVVPVQNATTYVTVRDELRQFYAAIDTDYYPEFLAIVATNPFIPLGEVDNPSGFPASILMTDTIYAHMDADPFLEIAVGRVIANNFSEGSLIASRISTYDSLRDRNWENRFAQMGNWGVLEAVPALTNFGYEEDDLMGADHSSGPPIEDGLILHSDHSAWWTLGNAFNTNMDTLLAPAFVVSQGCSTAALDMGPSQVTKSLFRQGAVGFMGGTRNVIAMSGHQVSEVINSVVEGESLGQAFIRAYEAVTLNVLDSDDHGSDVTRHNWLLIGDPALVLHVPCTPWERLAHANISLGGENLTVTGPENWWVRPYPESLLVEWGWFPRTLHAVIGAGTALMSYWNAPGYNFQIPYFVAKYRTRGHVLDISQQTGVPAPLGWGGSFANHVHVDEHADGTRTYLWRVRLIDFDQEDGGIIDDAVAAVSYTITPDPWFPTVSFHTPSGNVILNEGDDLYVRVDAADADGISQVRLYKDGVKLVRDEDSSPFEWAAPGQTDPELQDLSPGTFVLTAQATDAGWGIVGQTVVDITVTVEANGSSGPVWEERCVRRWIVRPLTSDVQAVSAAAASTVQFDLDAGTAYAGRDYLLLMGATGHLPGTRVAFGVTLPLNIDAVTLLALQAVNTPMLANFAGTLDAKGQATAMLDTLGPLPAGVVGGTLTLAYLTRSPIDFTSNALEIAIEP